MPFMKMIAWDYCDYVVHKMSAGRNDTHQQLITIGSTQ